MAAPLPRRTSCENEVMMQRKHVCGRENESILARAIAWPDNRIVSWSNNLPYILMRKHRPHCRGCGLELNEHHNQYHLHSKSKSIMVGTYYHTDP